MSLGDDDLDAIAMHDMGSERIVRHHHQHVEHHRHPRKWSIKNDWLPPH